ncbi:MAG TPA: replication-relaxation family protein [Solirubrobacteraceae bacterium]|nr:replication-relaxation family protein [Solirubrobacteraceae bacterium]
MLRFLLWRLLGVVAVPLGFLLIAWFVGGGPGRVLRGSSSTSGLHHVLPVLWSFCAGALSGLSTRLAGTGSLQASLLTTLVAASSTVVVATRWRSRRRRTYVRLRVEAYRTDTATAESLVTMFDALHKRLLRRWWRRLVLGQPSISLEVHHTCGRDTGVSVERASGDSPAVCLAVTCPQGLEAMVEAALQSAYPNCRLRRCLQPIGVPPAILRLKKQYEFIRRVKVLDRFEHERAPPMNRLMTVMGACREAAHVQVSLTPAPASFERLAKYLYRRHEARLSRERREHMQPRDRSMLADSELRGGLDVQHRALFFVDIRVVAQDRRVCERIASELRAEGAENRLVERGTAVRHGLFGLYGRRVQRGEGNPVPSLRTGVFATTELAALWQLPSIDYMTVPFARNPLPLAPAPPSIFRPPAGQGTLRDAHGGVSIHVELRKQNTAVPGTVEQGKSSFLVASVAEDLLRDRCAVIVLDPKGDAAEAAVSLVAPERTCTLLDFARPTCGFNPLAVDAPADVIADYVVAALKNLFTDADIRASSDRYLRNAIIAVLAYDRGATLWDAARLLSVGEEGYSYRRSVGARVRALPEFKEISQFFTAELTAQLADARSVTTAKLDAPVNKLARLLNSPSIKRVLLNDSLRLDFDRLIAERDVLVVKGALGAMGAGNTSVLMQLLVGMLDAALARQQDLVSADRRVAVALKIDEAPLVLNRGFAETMTLKRSAGLETVACWQTDAQWTDRDVREQLDALFAHRVYFATASARDARSAVALTMAAFSDTVRPGITHLSSLGHPDVRLHLPKHHAVASWTTPEGRQAPFVAETIPLRVDPDRIAIHAARQFERGGRHRTDLRQPHWDSRARDHPSDSPAVAAGRPSSPQPPSLGEARNLPAIAAESYRELVELDGAHSVRWGRKVTPSRTLEPDQLDLEILALIATLRHVLTSQIHRRFNADRAVTTTQRRLKRLSDAGLVERFQFHRRDGGGVPMCYVLMPEGLAMLRAARGLAVEREGDVSLPDASTSRSLAAGERRLREARRDVHVAGWVLSLERATSPARCALRGPEESVLSPPMRSSAGGQTRLGPGDLRLPGGRTPHDFVRTDAGGEALEVEHFDTVRPNAIVELSWEGREQSAREVADAPSPNAIDVLVELDDRLPIGAAAAKLERYDHFLSGWATHTTRYGRRLQAIPVVVFVCRDRHRARECARRADAGLRACRAYAGEYPFDWDYPAREQILFASERDMHEGLSSAYGVPRLPPAVRASSGDGDPSAREAVAEAKDLLGVPMGERSRPDELAPSDDELAPSDDE